MTFEEKSRILAFSFRTAKSPAMIAVKIRLLSREVRILYFYQFCTSLTNSILKKYKKVIKYVCTVKLGDKECFDKEQIGARALTL